MGRLHSPSLLGRHKLGSPIQAGAWKGSQCGEREADGDIPASPYPYSRETLSLVFFSGKSQ